MQKNERRKARRLTFGEVLAIVRISQNLTVEELAELSGWLPARIQVIERTGGASVTEAEAVELAKALDVEPQRLTVAVLK